MPKVSILAKAAVVAAAAGSLMLAGAAPARAMMNDIPPMGTIMHHRLSPTHCAEWVSTEDHWKYVGIVSC